MTRRKFQGHKRADVDTSYHDEGFDRLTEKLYRWLIAQPEWVAILSGPRAGKREMARRIAAMVTNIPAYASAPPEPRRVMNIRVGSGEKEAQSPSPVQGSLEDTPGPTLHTAEDHEAAMAAYMDDLEREEASR